MDFDPVNLGLGFVFGTIGIALVRWARKQSRLPHLVAGIVLLIAPYLSSSPAMTLGVCGVTLGL
ncbi:MAG: hypothetical protein H6747_15550 [Deltaproteobacteria bacterium]|nr:hypothetical protein [Deltaproteobacteria bacterium]